MRRILYVQYTNPAGYPPLEHSSRILADCGWEVLFLGSGALGEADAFQFEPHPRIRTERWRYSGPGWRQKAHFTGFCLWTWWRSWRSGARWIYASEPLTCPAAWLAGRLPGRRVIYHEHDSPTVNDATPFFRRILGARRRLCQRAAAVVLPNAERARVFAETVRPACPVLTVWNCPGKRDVLPLRKRVGGCTLFYHGSINALRLPISVVHALTRLPDRVSLEIAGYTTEGNRNYITEFLAEAGRLNLTGRVKFLGAFSRRHDLLPYCARADIGLAFMPAASGDLNMRAMTGASNKPFDYLACGLNLLVSDLPDWRTLFVEPGYARTCDPTDGRSIAGAVSWFLDHPVEAEAARASGRQRILDEWNYETQFAPVLRMLNCAKSA